MANTEWTILVYMAGDNSLSDDMAIGIADLQKLAGDLKTIKFMGYFDSGTALLPTKIFDFSKPNDMGIQVNQGFETDSADPASIREFIQWCVQSQSVPTNNYALILSGHGDGFQQSSFLRDEEPLGNMTIPGLKGVLADFKNITGKDLSILGFDTCVMSTIEVANEFKTHAKVMVSSQGYVPSTGWSYRTLVEKLKSLERPDPQQPPVVLSQDEIVKAMICSYMDYSDNFATITGRSTDISACDLSKLSEIVSRTHELAITLNEGLNSTVTLPHFLDLLQKSHQISQTFLFDQSTDIGDFAENLGKFAEAKFDEISEIFDLCGVRIDIGDVESNPEQFRHSALVLKLLDQVKTKCESLRLAVVDCIRGNNFFRGPDSQYANGLSIFFPWSFFAFRMTEVRYKEFSFAANGGTDSPWTEFLKNYLQKGLREIANKFEEIKIDPLTGKPRGDFNAQVERFSRTKNFPTEWSKKRC